MAEPRPDFWDSGLPFISDAESRRVDWTDVGLLSVGAVLSSFFSSLADIVSTAWNVLVIQRVNAYSGALTEIVRGGFESASEVLSFDAGIALADSTGFIGALILVAVGGYLLAWIVGVVRSG